MLAELDFQAFNLEYGFCQAICVVCILRVRQSCMHLGFLRNDFKTPHHRFRAEEFDAVITMLPPWSWKNPDVIQEIQRVIKAQGVVHFEATRQQDLIKSIGHDIAAAGFVPFTEHILSSAELGLFGVSKVWTILNSIHA